MCPPKTFIVLNTSYTFQVWRMMQFFVRYLTMCKDVQEENRENLGESGRNESSNVSNNSSKYEYDERKLRSSRERREPIGGEIELEDQQQQQQQRHQEVEPRKVGKKSGKSRFRSRSNQDETFNDERKTLRQSQEYSDDV